VIPTGALLVPEAPAALREPTTSIVISHEDGVEVVQVAAEDGHVFPLLDHDASLAFKLFRARERSAHAALAADMDRRLGQPLSHAFNARAGGKAPTGLLKLVWLAVRAAADVELARLAVMRARPTESGSPARAGEADLLANSEVAVRVLAGYSAISSRALARVLEAAEAVLQPAPSASTPERH
jgi:hypothetical protein